MKKYLALFLVCAMLLPLLSGCGVSAAGSETGSYTVEPFYGVGGTLDYPEDRYPYVQDFHRVVFSIKGDTVTFGGATAAEKAKNILDQHNENMRVIRPHYVDKVFAIGAEAVIYLDYGVEKAKTAVSAFLEAYHGLGGKLSCISVDLEYIGLSDYYISRELEKDPLLLNKIVSHPNYATEVRPLLEERGFQFGSNDSPYTTELWAVYDKSGEEYEASRQIWNRVMRNRLNQYVNEAFYEPALKYYPDIIVTDYQGVDSYAWFKEINGKGEAVYIGGNGIKAGNTSSYECYARDPISNLMTENKGNITYTTPYAYNGVFYADTPFNMFLWDANRFKNIYQATDTKSITAYLTGYDYNAEREGSVSNTPYYTETAYHIGMLDPETLLLYIWDDSYETEEAYFKALDVLNEILAELTRVAGYSDREPIVLPASWNSGFVLSGMYAGGRNIWRITPDTTNGVTKESFKTDAIDPTFRIDGQTITFPGGKIIEDSKIDAVGTCGYWVETKANVVPIIKNEDFRYRNYPAYLEGFEGYAEDTKLTYEKLMPAGVWELTDPTRESVKVVADKKGYNNNVLAFTGNVSLYCTKLPANVTSADSYALDQAWELRVTMPETMPKDAAIIVLNTGVDGGFKITADKCYYDRNGEYVEAKDMVFAPDQTYTIRRTVKLVGEETFLSSYYVFDAKGILVGQAENIPMKKCKLPVEKIGFSCENMGENAVYFDNFRLFAVGFKAEFELYDGELGIQIQDTTAAQTGDVAYRYSWMNASAEEVKVVLVARVYEGDKMVSETPIKVLTMQPGYDGVETGIYEAGDTATVIAVKSLQPQASDFMMTLFLVIAAVGVITCAIWLISRMEKAKRRNEA